MWFNFTIVSSASLGDFVLMDRATGLTVLSPILVWETVINSFFCTSHGDQKLTAFIQYPFSVLKAIVLKLFSVVLLFPLICSFSEFLVCTIWKCDWFVLDWWISSKSFLHFGISGQIFLSSIFEVLDCLFHPASFWFSQKDGVGLHLIYVHHCIVCSFVSSAHQLSILFIAFHLVSRSWEASLRC